MAESFIGPKTIWSAYSDGVISSAEISFKENESFEYCSSTLLGNFRYKGQYTWIEDTIYLNYNNQSPMLKSTKLVVQNNNLIFLNETGNNDYSFSIDN